MPNDVATDGKNLFVTDSGTIRKVAIATGTVTTLAGTRGVYGTQDGTGAAAGFESPVNITTDGINLFVSDNTIRKIVIATGVVSTLAGSADVRGSSDGTGAAASFSGPSGLTTDGINLFISDSLNNTIRKIVIASGAVSTLAGSAGVCGSADGVGSAARFRYPRGITTDGSNLYLTDFASVRKIEIATGLVITVAGAGDGSSTEYGFGSVDGTATTARFYAPSGITTDGTSLFVVDTTVIRRIQ